MGDTYDSAVAIKELKEEIAALQRSLRMTDGYKRDMATAAEQVLLDSPLVKLGKWFLGLAILIGLAIWLGGSIYQGIQIKSIDARTADVEQQIDKKLGERTKAIDDRATEAQNSIDTNKGTVSKAADSAVTYADDQKNQVRTKLAVDQLPNIQTLKPQLEALAQSGGRLNLHCLSLLSGTAVWLLFGVAGLSFLMSLYAVVRSHH